MNKKLIFIVLAASIFFNVMPALAVTQQSDNPYSFQWWYNYQSYDNNDGDDDDDKKHSSKHNNHHKDNSNYKPKTYCAGSGTWNGHECIINDEVEKAAYEDAVCDDPKDTQKYSNVCGGNSNNKVDEKRMVKERGDPNSGISDYANEHNIAQKQPKMLTPVNGQFFGYPDVKPSSGYGTSSYTEESVKAEQDRIDAEKDKQASKEPTWEEGYGLSTTTDNEDDDDDKKGDDTPKSDDVDSPKDDSHDDNTSNNNNNDNSNDDSGDSGDSESDSKDSKDSGDN